MAPMVVCRRLAHPPIPTLARGLDDGGNVSLKNVTLLREAIGDLRHLWGSTSSGVDPREERALIGFQL